MRKVEVKNICEPVQVYECPAPKLDRDGVQKSRDGIPAYTMTILVPVDDLLTEKIRITLYPDSALPSVSRGDFVVLQGLAVGAYNMNGVTGLFFEAVAFDRDKLSGALK